MVQRMSSEFAPWNDTTALGTDVFGNIQRLDNLLESMADKLTACEDDLCNAKQQLESAKADVEKPFPHEEELKTKTERLAELNALLDMDKKDNEIVDGEREDGDEKEPDRSDSRRGKITQRRYGQPCRPG